MIDRAVYKSYNEKVSVSVITPSLLMFAVASATSLIKRKLPIRRGLFLCMLSTLTLYFFYRLIYTLLIINVSRNL